jgi:K+-transporting ATPase KdpF subunit
MRGFSAVCEAAAMIEIFFGLAVAMALGVYLIITLILPERF